jgi:hypothetical protein
MSAYNIQIYKDLDKNLKVLIELTPNSTQGDMIREKGSGEPIPPDALRW